MGLTRGGLAKRPCRECSGTWRVLCAAWWTRPDRATVLSRVRAAVRTSESRLPTTVNVASTHDATYPASHDIDALLTPRHGRESKSRKRPALLTVEHWGASTHSR